MFRSLKKVACDVGVGLVASRSALTYAALAVALIGFSLPSRATDETLPTAAAVNTAMLNVLVPYLLPGFAAMAGLSCVFWIVGLMIRRRRV